MVKHRLARGNGKLDKSILNWSITPVKSCMNCNDCKDTCYALAPYNRWPNVKTAWDKNFELAKDGSFVPMIVKQLNAVKKQVVVRIHVAGDFFSQDYLNDWNGIVKQFPNITFYTYSKCMELLDFSDIMANDNFNIINSVCSDGGKNYGDMKRVNYLKSIGYSVCPATVAKKGVDVTCGKNCKICQTQSKVCFLQHK